MTVYAYKAVLRDGGFEQGKLEAEGQTEALACLRRDGKLPVRITKISGRVRDPQRAAPRGPAELATFFADLAMLMNAGLTVDQALKTFTASHQNRRLEAVAANILQNLAAGDTVASAMEKASAFPAESIALAASAEKVGRLAEVFSAIAIDFERQAKSRRALLEALAYPVFLVILVVIAVILISIYLVPALTPIFDSAGVEPPPVVWVLTVLREVMLDYGVAFVAVGGLTATSAIFAPTRRRLLSAFGKVWAALPGIRRIRHDLSMAGYLQSLAMLLQNGAQMEKALELSAACCGQPRARSLLAAVREEVAHGANLTDALRGTQLFNNSALSLIEMGDEVNRLPMALDRCSAILRARSTQAISKALAVLAPAVIILLGLIIALLVTSVMTALLSVNELAI